MTGIIHKWGICLLLVLGFSAGVYAQELIPNGGFEHSGPDFRPLYWRQPTPPFFHYTAAGAKHPADAGRFYNGLCVRKSALNENMQVSLEDTLKKDSLYCFSMLWRRSGKQKWGLENFAYMGLFFSQDSFFVSSTRKLGADHHVLLYTTKLDTMWTLTEGVYKAKGGEQYLTLGSFAESGHEVGAEINAQNLLDSLERKLNEQHAIRQRAFAREKDSLMAIMRAQMTTGKQEGKRKKQDNGKDVRILIQEINEKEKKMNLAFHHEKTLRIQHVVDSISHTAGSFDVRVEFDNLSLIRCPDQSLAAAKLPASQSKSEKINLQSVELRDVLFETAKAELVPTSVRSIDSLAAVLEQNSQWTVKLMGHTDMAGNERDNYILSQQRARAVADYLVSKGIGEERIRWEGFGSSQPRYPNDSRENMQRNRRVEFILNTP